MNSINHQIRLAARPSGLPTPSDWELATEPVPAPAIDYKAQDVGRALREHPPDGVDVFLDNVGGEILDAVLTRLARGARIVLSGGVSQYTTRIRPVVRPIT